MKQRKIPAFTIVELLIVIVVIAILAAISIVAYNGIQNRARASAASSALSQAAKKIALYQVDNSAYPTTGNLAAAGVSNTGGTYYQYSSTGSMYCLTASVSGTSYNISNTNQVPQAGACSGHASGGVVTNLAIDPRATGNRWFNTISGTTTRTLNVSWSGKTNWSRFVSNTSTTSRLYLNLSDLTDGTAYNISFVVGNSGSSTVSFSLDFCDNGTTSFSVSPGEQKRIAFTSSRSSYDSTFRFIDLNLPVTDSSGILISDGMVTSGTNQYSYADGNAPDWIWNGTPNNSTSTGPPL